MGGSNPRHFGVFSTLVVVWSRARTREMCETRARMRITRPSHTCRVYYRINLEQTQHPTDASKKWVDIN
ncbi:hypothetical protein PGTUg99_000749 [Puccinia graminis f. sp. tritici]|uniref:Uncharacterized protein n=1 Tax=Puccinia graminis f. sp. tritici TaxID=56615 RepID=A0A5B0S9F1_PUCGR|nr:hypothetical protein PGTUg99_010549 [Puccinia graminis f. sp. tritici]KAA1134437.1 hypothetical protein PGTUg99_000749 [Puccinia graminis f. sp. tritici]